MRGDGTSRGAFGRAARRDRLERLALLALASIAGVWLGYQGWRLLGQTGYWGAIDLGIYHRLVGEWFTGRPVFAARVAVHPPASLLAMWPFVGWLPFGAARWLWAGVFATTLALAARSVFRRLGPTSESERAFAGLLLLAIYPTGATIGNGQMGIPLLAAALALVEILERPPTLRRSLAASALLFVLLLKLSWGPPFFLAVLVLPAGLGIAALAGGSYAVATALAASFREESLPTLLRAWYAVAGRAQHGVANLHGWLKDAGLGEWTTEAAFALLALFGIWALRHRRASPAALFGVAAVVARLFTYHNWYDDLLLVVPLVVVLRAARAPGGAAPRGARALAAAGFLLLLAPGGLFTLPEPARSLYVAAQVVQWLGMAGFCAALAAREQRQASAAAAAAVA